MATKDFRDGLFGLPSKRTWTADNLPGRVARDKLFGTNNTGWNPPKPNPISLETAAFSADTSRAEGFSDSFGHRRHWTDNGQTVN
jgi:hypothetical protein